MDHALAHDAGICSRSDTPCVHKPSCPPASSPAREAAHVIAAHPEQGWSLLCNGVLNFEDTGEILPNGTVVAPHRPATWS
ncbi:DUF5999 family protein [Streptomyces sp. NPDC056656]|uniref:DUF5999 family protein n=1 Tax=Streptomyces sp. NPDC056656 TaxID=3345895 RepID=UPI003699885E